MCTITEKVSNLETLVKNTFGTVKIQKKTFSAQIQNAGFSQVDGELKSVRELISGQNGIKLLSSTETKICQMTFFEF